MKDKRDYILKITHASGVELVIVTYDLLLDHIGDAAERHDRDPNGFIESVNRARDVLMELIGALNMEYSVSKEIFPVYMHINTLLISALSYERRDKLEEAARLLGILREGWLKVRESGPESDKLYVNPPVVYSGLTYGKNGPNDYFDANPRRGIQA